MPVCLDTGPYNRSSKAFSSPVLKSLDLLIGFSAIMLLLSVAVTILTQAVTGALGWRSAHLARSLATIVNQLDPKMTPYFVEQIASAVLRHPLVARAEGKPGAVIQREELLRILLELAATREPRGKSLDECSRSTLKRALETNGISHPAEVLENLHLTGLKLEALYPEMSRSERHSIAVATEAPSQFAGCIHACFDETMDRATHRFARHAQLVTAGISLLVAVGLQLDAFDLLRRIPVEGANAYSIVPRNWTWDPARVPGIVFSAMLLSLGAPFWYNALKDLVGLRPLLARAEQAQRQRRQSARGPALAFEMTGEKGDLSATGAAG
jgi:hypothetical protein